MPSSLWNTRVETRAPNGTVVVTIPRNVQLKIPSLRFEGLPAAAIQMHLNALELASTNGPQRIALRNHFEHSPGVVQYDGTRTFSGAYETVRGDLPFGNNTMHLNDGSANLSFKVPDSLLTAAAAEALGRSPAVPEVGAGWWRSTCRSAWSRTAVLLNVVEENLCRGAGYALNRKIG